LQPDRQNKNFLQVSFQLQAPFEPAGDQPDAIRQLTEGILSGEKYQTLL
jgi:excinuclease ABC subunit B